MPTDLQPATPSEYRMPTNFAMLQPEGPTQTEVPSVPSGQTDDETNADRPRDDNQVCLHLSPSVCVNLMHLLCPTKTYLVALKIPHHGVVVLSGSQTAGVTVTTHQLQ